MADDGGKVVRGPWAPARVQQSSTARPRRPEAWWSREGSSLRVTNGDRWFVAPVPEAKITPGYPQPNRLPDRDRITMALDARGMYGPEVDEALGVLEPVVDQWESGDLDPTPADVRRLATLTGYLVHWFYAGPLPKIERGFICGRGAGGGGCRPLGVDVVETGPCPHCGAPQA